MRLDSEMIFNFFRGVNLDELAKAYLAPQEKYDTLNAFFLALIRNRQQDIQELGDKIRAKKYYENIDISKTLLNFRGLNADQIKFLDKKSIGNAVSDSLRDSQNKDEL